MKTKSYTFPTKILVLIFILDISFSSITAKWVQAQNTDPANAITAPLILAEETTTALSAPITANATAANAVISSTKLTWDAVGKNTLDYIAYAAAQNLLTQLTNSTVKWIQGGFHGKPSFEVDIERTALEIADSIAGDLVLKLRGVATCKFTASYTDDLANTIYLAPKKRDYIFDNKAKCPFQEKYNFSATEFYAGANTLTWDAYGAMMEDSGNPYGVQAVYSKEFAKREAEAKAKNEKKLSWSNGYADIVDTKNCNYPPGTFATKENYVPATNLDGTPREGDEARRQADADAENANIIASPEFKQIQKNSCAVTTPGNILSDQLSKSLNVDMDRIGFADNMNKIISAFLDQVMQKTVRGVFGTGNRSYTTSSLGDPLADGGGGPSFGGASGVFGSAKNVCFVRVETVGAKIIGDLARLNGTITCADGNSNAVFKDPYFEYADADFSTDSSVLPKKVALSLPLAGNTATAEAFSSTIGNLTPGITYYFRASAVESDIRQNPVVGLNKFTGDIMTFIIPLPVAP